MRVMSIYSAIDLDNNYIRPYRFPVIFTVVLSIFLFTLAIDFIKDYKDPLYDQSKKSLMKGIITFIALGTFSTIISIIAITDLVNS